jgi:hypothetical protein
MHNAAATPLEKSAGANPALFSLRLLFLSSL